MRQRKFSGKSRLFCDQTNLMHCSEFNCHDSVVQVEVPADLEDRADPVAVSAQVPEDQVVDRVADQAAVQDLTRHRCVTLTLSRSS